MPGTSMGAQLRQARSRGLNVEEVEAKILAGLSWCYLCRDWYPIERFTLDRSRPDGRGSVCKPCVSLKCTASRYGISIAQARKLRTGNEVCDICGRRRKLEVDHNHKSGEIRGMLCRRCNGGLGQFLDDSELLRAALRYLEERDGTIDEDLVV